MLCHVIADDILEILAEIVTEDVMVLITEQNVEFAFELPERGSLIEKGSNVWDGPIDELHDRDPLDEQLSVSASEVDYSTETVPLFQN